MVLRGGSMNLVIGALLIIASGACCCFLDTVAGVKSPALYWTLGGITGIIAISIMTAGLI